MKRAEAFCSLPSHESPCLDSSALIHPQQAPVSTEIKKSYCSASLVPGRRLLSLFLAAALAPAAWRDYAGRGKAKSSPETTNQRFATEMDNAPFTSASE